MSESMISQYIPALSKSMFRKQEQLSQSLKSGLANTVSRFGEYKTNFLYSIKHSDLAPMSRKEL